MAEYLKKATPPAPADLQAVRDTVTAILADVKRRGIDAVREYSRRFDDWDPPSFRVSSSDIEAASQSVDEPTRDALDFAIDQIGGFAGMQRRSMQDLEVESLPGVILGHKHVPIGNVGAYIPGGRYPLLMSAQMSVLTAKTAGVPRVVACAPPYEGKGMYPAMLLSIARAGADEIWCIGGVQALAAMAYGMEGLAPVDLIAGPGNMYVAEAKRQLFGEVGIDLIAGPTDILIIADDSSDPFIVAADLLGQAEHGPTSPTILVSLSREMGRQVLAEVERQLVDLPTREVAAVSWRDFGEVVVVGDRDEAVAVADDHAPEHLEVQTADADWYLDRLGNYGTLCIGEEATITFSDKAIGTNHTLPTGRAARYTGGLWVGKFLKTVTYQRCTREGALLVAPHAALLSDAEHMLAHGLSAKYRIEKYGG